MAASKTNKKQNDDKKTKKTAKEDDEKHEIPEDVAAYKQKLEQTTGKKYKYRPREATPGIWDLLQQGADPNDPPQTFWQKLKFPLILALVFVITSFLFLKFVPPAPRKYFLPTRGGDGKRQPPPLQKFIMTQHETPMQEQPDLEPMETTQQQEPPTEL